LLYKSIRPTRYLIVKDLGRSRRAEEEALTSFHPCQRLSAFFLKEHSASSQGLVPLSLRRGVLLTEAKPLVNHFLHLHLEKILPVVSASRPSLAARGVSM
jgi:hypothetical protein